MNVLSNKQVKTRKPHCCAYCGRKIEAGAIAQVWVCEDGGDIQRNYAHFFCDMAATFIKEFEQDEYIDSNIFYDDIHEYYTDNLADVFTPEEWAKYTPEEQCGIILGCENVSPQSDILI